MATKKGTKKSETLIGTGSADTIYGYDGNDTLKGQGGNDRIYGGNGNDKIYGGTGNDKLYGDAGNDTFYADAGNDTITGGSGNDTVVFSGLSTAVTATKVGSSTVITGASTGTDTLSSVEFVQFSDGKFSLTAKNVALTTGIDNLVGSFSDDTYTGAISTDFSFISTLGANDTINGAGGTGDTLRVTVSGAGGDKSHSGVTLNALEKVYVTNAATGGTLTQTFNTFLWNGLTTLGIDSAADGSLTVFDNVKNLVTADMRNGEGNLTIVYDGSLLAGIADVQNVVLSNNADGSLWTQDDFGNTAETLNISSITGPNTLNINGAATTIGTLNVTGDQLLDLFVSDMALTSVNAGGMTGGGVNLYGVAATTLSYTGSSANDRLVLSTDSLDGTDTINGGGGSNLLGFDGNADISSADLANVTNIQSLATGGGLLTATLGAGAQTAGITTVQAFGNGQVSIVVDSATFTRALTVDLDVADPGSTPGYADDLVDGGAMTQKLTVTALADHIDGNDTLTGGSNSGDELVLKADNGTAFLNGLFNFEKVTVAAGTATTEDIEIITADTTVSAGVTMTVSAAALTNSAASLSFDGTSESDGNFVVTGGAGADILAGGGGNDSIDGGNNDDILGGGAGNDTLKGGSGNDRIVTSASNLDNLDSIDGGIGTDTLVLDDNGPVTDTDFTKITSIEVIASGDATSLELGTSANGLDVQLDTLAKAAGVGTITGAGSNADIVQVASGFTNALTVNIAGGADRVTSASSAALTVSANVSDIEGSDTLTGGSGSGDILRFIADGGATTLGVNITGFETFTIAANGSASAEVETVDANVAAGATLVVNASALTNPLAAFTFEGDAETNGKFNITGGNGNDLLSGGAGNDTINGGSGADTIIGGTGEDSLLGGSSDDVFVTLLANLSSADRINGESHTLGDQLQLIGAGGTVDDVMLANVSNVEILDGRGLGSAMTAVLGIEAYNSGSGFKSVQDSSSSDVVTIGSAFTGAISVDIKGGGNDSVSASGSSATVTIASWDSTLDSGDSLTGGSGTGDTLSITANYGTADLTNVTGFETLTVVANAGADTTIVVGSSSVVAAGKTFVVNAAALTDGGTMSFDGTAENATLGSFTVTGGSGADTIAGGSGADSITGGSGDDHLLSGIGNDTVNGGLGADTVYIVGTFTVGGITATNNGLDTVLLGSDASIDTAVFDLGSVVTGLSTINEFDAVNEDLIKIFTGTTWANGGAGEVRASTAAGSSNVALVVLDNGTFASTADAASAADNLHAAAGANQSYVFAWTDSSNVVRISYATTDTGSPAENNSDQFVDMVKLSNVSIANIDLTDLFLV